MSQFNYRAKNEKGESVTGVVDARNEKQAAVLLQAKKLFIISIKPKRDGFFQALKIFNRVKMDDRVNFTRQLATMITSGLTLTESLSLLENQARPVMGRIIGEISLSVEGGGSLADSLEKFPEVFDRIYISLVRAGEAAGILDEVLQRLAQNLEKKRAFYKKIQGALIYPAIIAVGMVVVALVLMIFVIPRLTVLYEEFNAQLPAITKIFLAISNFISSFWWLGLFGAVGVIILGPPLFRLPEFKKRFDDLYFQIPVWGKLRRQVILTEFTRTLGLLVEAGILVIDALNISRDSLESYTYEQGLNQAIGQVEKGYPLAYALAQTGVFPPLLSQMVSVGEETGKLDEVLKKTSAYFEQEAEFLIQGLTTSLEPLILMILGLGVGFLMVSVILPIYKLIGQI